MSASAVWYSVFFYGQSFLEQTIKVAPQTTNNLMLWLTLLSVPFYIGFGSHDSVGRSARALADVLRGAGWPVRLAEHPVGHGAKEIYLDEAFAFWREHDAR